MSALSRDGRVPPSATSRPVSEPAPPRRVSTGLTGNGDARPVERFTDPARPHPCQTEGGARGQVAQEISRPGPLGKGAGRGTLRPGVRTGGRTGVRTGAHPRRRTRVRIGSHPRRRTCGALAARGAASAPRSPSADPHRLDARAELPTRAEIASRHIPTSRTASAAISPPITADLLRRSSLLPLAPRSPHRPVFVSFPAFFLLPSRLRNGPSSSSPLPLLSSWFVLSLLLLFFVPCPCLFAVLPPVT
jgi:hypothetical protein